MCHVRLFSNLVACACLELERRVSAKILLEYVMQHDIKISLRTSAGSMNSWIQLCHGLWGPSIKINVHVILLVTSEFSYYNKSKCALVKNLFINLCCVSNILCVFEGGLEFGFLEKRPWELSSYTLMYRGTSASETSYKMHAVQCFRENISFRCKCKTRIWDSQSSGTLWNHKMAVWALTAKRLCFLS